MKARSCAELAELRSAYVDGALDDADRERLLIHLVDCRDCRRDVAELRHVRALLTGSADPGLTPVDLSHRLVSIAGDEATEPLWTRPFRRTPAGGRLPSRRRQVRIRAVAALLGCGLAALTILGVGYLSAPVETLAETVDPTGQAITEFTTVVSAFPLDSRVSAALQGRRPSPASRAGYPIAVTLPAGKLSAAKAAKLLAEAGQAGAGLSYTARQVVVLTRDDERLSNSVRVANRGGSGAELSPGRTDQVTASVDTYVRPDSSTRMADAELIDLLANRYTLRGWKGQTYGGRPAYLVEAIEPTMAPGNGELAGVAARWWVDAGNYLILGQETFDGRGNLVVSSRLTDLRFMRASQVPVVGSGSPARTNATLTLSRTAELRRDGWICADRLAGLQLLRLRTDQVRDPGLVHLVYSDGLTTLSVVEERGRLAGAPADSVRNETLAAWVTEGMPLTATWTSGDVVLTAVTDGSRETLAAAVAALPHEGLRQPTTMERVRAGWARLLGR